MLKQAQNVALGEFVVVRPSETARVTTLCRNTHYGWIGFELNDSARFMGWFKPEQEVEVVTRDERPEGCSKGCAGRMCRDALNCDGKRS